MRRISATLFAFSLLLLGLLSQGSVHVTEANNLLQNPGFEGTYGAWLPQYSTAQMAPNWTPWWVEDASENFAQPEYKDAQRFIYPDRVLEGDHAQQYFTFYKSHLGGVFQQVNGVTPGQTYRFTIHVQAWSNNIDSPTSDQPADPNFEIGIDPTGDARPGPNNAPSSVVWSGVVDQYSIYDQWRAVSVEVVAQNSTITVYVKSSPQKFGGNAVKHNNIYLDAAELISVGTPPPPQDDNNGGGGGGGSDDCVIPPSGPWPPCATGGDGGGSGTTPPPATGDAAIARWTSVYDSPGGSAIAGISLAPGTPVTVLETQGGWSRIQADTVQGWVPNNALTAGGGGGGGTTPPPATGNDSITRWTNVYSSPGGAAIPGASLAPGTSVNVVETQDGWARVQAGSIDGWVPRTALANNGGSGDQGNPGGGGGGDDCVIPPSGPWPPCATGGGGGGTTPPPSDDNNTPPPPPGGGSASGFQFGGQTHTLANPGLMQDVGMGWVKFQHKWAEDQSPQEIAARVSDAHARGFKVLMSMPGSPYPSSINFGAYTNFLRGVAQLPDPPDAIEIWNEMNIDFEWPAGQISASQYFNQMLKPGYEAIKGANPNIMVISGAPAPTGFFGGGCAANGCDDGPYLRELFNLGGANYMDCIGLHYNAGATSPDAVSGHPADNGAAHYSWYYNKMIDTYHGAFNGQRPVCITELGYLSDDGLPSIPPFPDSSFWWARDTSLSQHAQWLADATRKARDDNRVQMLIIFNVDFTTYSATGDPQAGYAMLRPGGSCPSCDLIKPIMNP